MSDDFVTKLQEAGERTQGIKHAPQPEPAREEIVLSSAWLGELEAVLRIAKLADTRLTEGKLDLCRWNIGQIQERLTQIIEAERGRSPSHTLDDTKK